MSKIRKFVSFLAIIFVITLFILLPQVCNSGVQRGLMICANIIIPSLFPFLVCVLIIMRMDFTMQFSVLNNLKMKTNALTTEIIFTMLLSMLGGYPVGARLINELYENRKINEKEANIILAFCVNAGPAFITIAVGCGIFASKTIGILLLLSHISASIVNALLFSRLLKETSDKKENQKQPILPFGENFVISTADASASILNICAFVIIFSVINSYLVYFSRQMPMIKYLVYFTEVTYAVTITRNLPFVSFLIAFSGFSIWFQIFHILKKIKINRLIFLVGRLLHGAISALITYILIHIFDIKIATLSNNIIFNKSLFVSNISLTVSLFATILLFLIFLYSENHSRKIRNDMI